MGEGVGVGGASGCVGVGVGAGASEGGASVCGVVAASVAKRVWEENSNNVYPSSVCDYNSSRSVDKTKTFASCCVLFVWHYSKQSCQ